MSSLIHSPAPSPGSVRWWRASPRLWPRQAQAVTAHQPIAVAGALTIFSAFLFMAFPGIDLAVSRWATSASGDFPLSREPMLVALRDFNRVLPYFILPCVLALFIVQVTKPKPWLLRPHKALFFLIFYAVGPGLLIQALKRLVGRARPYDITDFGGSLPFTPAWQVSSACTRSCSFASGESATAIALVALALLLPVRWRRLAIIALLLPILAFSLNRIVFWRAFPLRCRARLALDVVVDGVALGGFLRQWRTHRCRRAAVRAAAPLCFSPEMPTRRSFPFPVAR
ncbi:phosphatase PAP2 family protein [Ensifer sp. MJa1]|uniref:phosphatase PAP2 family protein n=1 Tax=Ensifer sp. MJa1 TaxID=2919888 RepID=UPI00300B57CA